MLFHSLAFAIFFLVVYTAYVATQGRLRAQNAILLIASYVFYGAWDWRFLSLIWLSTTVDYLCGQALDRRRCDAADPAPPAESAPYAYGPAARRWILILSVATNLGLLGFFKYCGFFQQGFIDLMGLLGLEVQPYFAQIVLPVGISFYTFQTLSYTIDIYRGQLRAHRSPLQFALFVAFFPQLIAGPIVRAREFLPQLSQPRELKIERISSGGYLILWGAFKKVVIADNLATLVYYVFSANHSSPPDLILLGVYAFAVQIYCDFSGYTDMARGLARMMGLELPVNFNHPYLAANPSDFWRRWHITLSTWLRDYLYIPLGGNRQGPRRTAINLMLTMMLGGLWHGAAWTFVVWGAYHGLLLVGYKAIEPTLSNITDRLPTTIRKLAHALAVVIFFHLVCLGWMIFRADSLAQVGWLLSQLGTPWIWWVVCGASKLSVGRLEMFVAFVLPLLLMEYLQWRRRSAEALLQLAPLWRGSVYAAMIYGLCWYGSRHSATFMYFQF